MTLKGFSGLMSAGFTAVVLAITAFMVVITARMNSTGAESSMAIQSVRAAEELQIHILSHNRESFLHDLTKAPSHQKNLDREKQAVYRWLEVAREHLSSESEESTFLATSHAIDDYFEAREKSSASLTPMEAFRQTAPYVNAAFHHANALTEMNLAQSESLVRKLESYDLQANWMGALVALFALAAIPVSWFLVRKWLYRPIERFHRDITSFSVGDRTEIAETGIFELRQIAQSFNELSSRLTEQRKFQQMFLASVAHDLRNPLGAIQMSAEELLSEDDVSEESRQMIDIISRQTAQLNRMVSDLLDSSRLEAGNFELRPQKVDLCSLAKDAVELHRPVTNIHRLELTCSSEKVVGNYDPLRIGQVLNNLISNAIKYSPNGGPIQIHVGTEGGRACLSVEDQGIGISEADQKHIYEPFRRTKLTKASIPGVGLGLSVVKRIVKAHGGEIELESSPQRGTKFVIWLPLTESERRVDRETRPAPSHSPMIQ